MLYVYNYVHHVHSWNLLGKEGAGVVFTNSDLNDFYLRVGYSMMETWKNYSEGERSELQIYSKVVWSVRDPASEELDQ